MWETVTPQTALVLIGGKKSRSISSKVLQTMLPLAPLTDEMNEEWSTQIGQVGFMGKGEVANLGYGTPLVTPALQAALDDWLASVGICSTPQRREAVPLVCTGATFHHDALSYPNEVFCIIWLSSGSPWDLYFPYLDVRIPLHYGTTVLFDACQPHGVVARGEKEFYEEDIKFESGIFLSQDLVVDAKVRAVMNIETHSRHGKQGFFLLNKEGHREELDGNTASWSIRDVNKRDVCATELVEA